MKEISTEAIVLNKEPLHESDCKVTFFCRDLGKISAKVKSGRRITSKLSPHLEPLNLVTLRLVGKNGLHVADALKVGELPVAQLKLLRFLDAILSESEGDYRLWSELRKGGLTIGNALALLGFDPSFAVCEKCGRTPDYFLAGDNVYLCRLCAGGGSGELAGQSGYFQFRL